VGEVEGEAAHRAGVGHDGGAAGPWDGPRGQQQRHVGEGVEPVHHRHAGVGQDDAGNGEISGHRAGMRLRGHPRGLGAPRLHEHEALAPFAGAGCEAQELSRLPDLLDEQRDDTCRGVVEDRRQEILGTQHRLVAGADKERDPETGGDERIADGVGDGTALGDDGDAGGTDPGRELRHRLVLAEGERDAIDVVDDAEAVGPVHQHAGLPR
jgi:hypothetical protein